jgi:hypothetical protein
MCPFSKSRTGHDPDVTPERTNYRKSGRRPSWARKAQEDVKRKRNARSNLATSNMSMADSIIGNINAGADVRIIFLDVDGVINHVSSNNEGGTVCPNCVNKLKAVLSQTSAKIVLSSTWRLNKRHRKTLFRHLRAIEVHQGVVVGETRDLRKDHKNRAEEINDWLSHPKLYKKKDIISLQPWQVQSWISLDDLDLESMQPNKHVKSRHIKLDPKLGLCGTDSIVTNVVQRLSKGRTIGVSSSVQTMGCTTTTGSMASTEGNTQYFSGAQRYTGRGVDEANRSHFNKVPPGHGFIQDSFVELKEAPENSKTDTASVEPEECE